MADEKTLDVLVSALGIRAFEELHALARLPKLQLLKQYRERFMLLTVPAPKITSPAPNALVAANRDLSVQITVAPGGPTHELILIQKVAPYQRWTAPVDYATGTATIAIPAGDNVEYYLEVGLASGEAEEEQRHRILIKTPPPLTADLSSDILNAAPNDLITFTLQMGGGAPPYNYLVVFDDGTRHPTTGAPASTSLTSVSLTHRYAAAGLYDPVAFVWDNLSDARDDTAQQITIA